MPFMVWTEKYSVKVKELDDHHKRLFELVNELHEAVVSERSVEVRVKVLNALLDYTIYHFSAEENLLLANGYPETVPHKQQHDELTKKVLAFRAQAVSGKAAVSKELIDFLRTWLDRHILGTDKRYSRFLNNSGLA